jgi:hypothetical protein
MKRLRTKGTLVAGCLLILAINLAILGLAGLNHRGEPTAELWLTSRELALPAARQAEGTGLEMFLMLTDEAPGVARRIARWKGYEIPSVEHAWLDRSKLRELGFQVKLDPNHPEAAHHYARAIPRPVYIAVEFDGETWARWLAQREEEIRRLERQIKEGSEEPGYLADAQAVLALDRTMRSRLFPVDAGLDAELLRERYADRARHAVITGLIRPKVIQPDDGEPFLSGTVERAVVRRVHVSREFGPRIEPFLPAETWEQIEKRERREAASGWPSPAPPLYRANVAVGRRHEPWLVGITGP